MAAKWRDVIKAHEAADAFPCLSADELRKLADDINAHGLKEKVTLWTPDDGGEAVLLDGRNRLDAMEAAGIGFLEGRTISPAYATVLTGGDPYQYVLSKNIHRRHLTKQQKVELIAK